MMEYGIMINNQLIRHKQYHDGDKPIFYTEMPELEDGFIYIYHWEEFENSIIQVWDMIEDAEAVYSGMPAIDGDADYADYEEALGRFGV